MKRWDYYAVFSLKDFFSAIIGDLGTDGNPFVQTRNVEIEVNGFV
jgi:hypothetical protein